VQNRFSVKYGVVVQKFFVPFVTEHPYSIAVADWGQKAYAAIGFTKTIETLVKNPHITLTKPQFLKKCIKNASQSLEKPQFL
jgi:hypothetical protein